MLLTIAYYHTLVYLYTRFPGLVLARSLAYVVTWHVTNLEQREIWHTLSLFSKDLV